NHVLDIVGVTGTIHVRIVTILGLVLDVGGGDGDAARLLFRSVINRVEAAEGDLGIVLAEHLGDGGGQGRLAVIDVADGADVDVRFAPIKFLFPHKFEVLNDYAKLK